MPKNLPQTSGSKRDWFRDTIKLFESVTEANRDDATIAATGIWLGYPLLGEAIECHLEWTDEEKYILRNDLNRVHHLATHHLMAEAERAALDPAPLSEERRVCQELLGPIRKQRATASSLGVVWFHHPSCRGDTWPDCLGEWRYALPPEMQEAIRLGEEVFTRLTTRLSVAPKDAWKDSEASGQGGEARIPAGATEPSTPLTPTKTNRRGRTPGKVTKIDLAITAVQRRLKTGESLDFPSIAREAGMLEPRTLTRSKRFMGWFPQMINAHKSISGRRYDAIDGEAVSWPSDPNLDESTDDDVEDWQDRINDHGFSYPDDER
jgi:hypothetical protein